MCRRSKEFAAFGFLLLLPRTSPTETTAVTRDNSLLLLLLLLLAHSHDDCSVEDLFDSDTLLRTTLHVYSTHLGCDKATLFRSNRCQALSFEKVDAGLFVAEVRLQTAEDDRRCRAEVHYFWVPLKSCQQWWKRTTK